MKVLIVEDEPKNIKILKRFISDYFPSLEIIGEAGTVEKAQNLYYELAPDLILLDIQLSKGNAFNFLDKILPVSCAIIFVTAYDNYALKAFKYNAVDYLLKPININELRAAIKKAEHNIAQQNLNVQLKQLIKQINNPSETKIALPVEDKFLFISTSLIMYCKAIGAKTIIHTSNNKTYITIKSIGEYEDILPEKIFFRIHNSYIINMNFIIKYVKGRGGYVEMQDGVTIEVAARRKDEFFSRFNN